MKIDSLDNIANKEKSPDKAERSASIEDIKKTQSKFFDFTNDLTATTANCGSNSLLDGAADYDLGASKLKKLLLHSNPEVANLNELMSNGVATTNNGVKCEDVKEAVNEVIDSKPQEISSPPKALKQKKFHCEECDQQFVKLALFNHMKCVHNKFTCLYCYGFFPMVEKLQMHLARRHKVQNTAFYDEESLKVSFEVDQDEDDKVINAVCCTCAGIFKMSEIAVHANQCGVSSNAGRSVKSAAAKNRRKNSSTVAVQQQQQVETSLVNNNHRNSISAAKEDSYCEQAIQQLLHQPPAITRTNFNGALNDLSSQNTNNVPLISNNDTTSSSVNTSSSMSWHEQHQQQPQAINNSENSNKLVVPKLTLKIPKAAFNYDNIDSDEDSGDEGSESEQESENESDNEERRSSSLSENDDKENEMRRPENMPILKLKIKNLTSTPELVHDNNISLPPSPQPLTDVDLSECPMDLEDEQQNQSIPVPEEPKIIIDGNVITPANEDIRPHDIKLDEGLDKINTQKFMKICLRASFPFCLYCNHARRIVVCGKALAIHFITNHRFNAMVESITGEELHPEKIVEKFVSVADELETNYFNLESYDDHDEDKREGHVTLQHDTLYECFQCRFKTAIHKDLYLHNRKMHSKMPIACLMCKFNFISYSELLCHVCPGTPKKIDPVDYKYCCCLCNKANIPSAFRLMVHLRKQHFACDVCLEKCSDQPRLSSHVWKHKLMHVCTRCHVYYQNKADIMKHLFWKHGAEGVECQKCLQKKWPHVYHFCTPPAVFQCDTCEMSFARAISLKIHARIHAEGGAKYPCTEIGCEKKFISKKLLVRHMERHQSEILENGDQERSAEGTVIIPKEIPDGLCTRTIPVVFKRFVKKPAVRKIEDEPKVEEKVEEAKKEEPKKLPDLPETKLNLSESSESENEGDTKERKNSFSLPQLQPSKSQVPSPLSEQKVADKSPKKSSTLTDSESDDDEKDKKPETAESMKNIMENLKSFQESQQQPSVPEEVEEEDEEDKMPANVITHVCQSDHDYSKLWRPPPGTTKDDLEDMIEKKTIEKEKNKKKDSKSPQKGKKKKNDDFSSSDSSSGSSSDSSSGSSSGSSSSGSSSSNSDSSSSEASALSASKPRKKKFTKKRSKVEIPEEEAPRDPDDIIYESDLLTDEADTDEDFYDEHPLKKNLELLEQRKETGMVDGMVENSRPSTPVLPPVAKEEEEAPRIKLKKRKHKKSQSSPSKRHKRDNDEDFSPLVRQKSSHQIHTSTPVPPRIELHQANQIRQLLQSTQQQPVLPILKEQQQYHVPPFPISTPISVSRVTSGGSSRINSGDEAGIKRSQRKRVPNKFYGYTSDDEGMAVHALQNDPFKPVPPPNLTWRKEDLPSKCKSPPRVAPFKLNLTAESSPQIYHNDFDMSPHQSPINHVSQAKSDSSSEDNTLYISEPQKRKRKAQSQSMYDFHTLETPPTVSQPPIPRLKLTIGSNNKIRRRNINPLKPPPKKRKVAANTSRPSFNPRQFDASLPARILQSPPPAVPETIEPSSSRKAQERLDKQQALDMAIQNTQLYFQRYNHAQVGSAEVVQDPTGDGGDGRVYCYCRRAYDEAQGMIGCDGANCPIEWFHFECVGILVPPSGSWYCPSCKHQPL